VLQYEIKKRYNLCNYCLYRQFAPVRKNNRRARRKINAPKNDQNSCYICEGLMNQLDSTIKKIYDNVEAKGYEYKSFLLGASLPYAFFEREDSIRARFKVRGKENIKKQFVDELRKRYQKITGKRAEHIAPDITINVVINNAVIDYANDGDNSKNKSNNINNNALPTTVLVKSSPVFLSGRYVKTIRGIPQKKDKCQNCLGNGCAICDYMGASPSNSVEAIIGSRLLEITKGDTLKFSWLGGEDKDSLVLGNGRPFLLQLSNPKVRWLKSDLTINENGVHAILKQQSPPISFQFPSHFTIKTKITIQAEQDFPRQSLATLSKVLENTEVSYQVKSKIVKKKIYSVKAQQIDEKRFVLTMIADGGLSIKQFVGGQDYIEPSISKIIGMKCECVAFDILNVNVQ
jgi:tRNA pseudouridine synthase 10